MICPQCGQYNEDSSRFCGNCGTDLASFAAAAQQPAQPQQSAASPYDTGVSAPAAPSPYDTGVSAPAAPSPYDTGVSQAQPQSYDYGQPQQQTYDYGQPQQQAYAPQPPAPAADPYAQQPYQQQYPQGYNAPVQQPKKKFPILPVIVGVVAVVAVVGGFLLFRGGSSGGGTTGTTGTTGTSVNGWVFDATYTNSDADFSFAAPSGWTIDQDNDAGNVWMHWIDPNYLYVHTYVGDAPSDVSNGADLGLAIALGNEDYNMSVVETGDNYAILVGTDPDDGDTNYTKAVMRGSEVVFMDVYYKPADDSTMRDVAITLMEGLRV